jgi:hypothetical protein
MTGLAGENVVTDIEDLLIWAGRATLALSDGGKFRLAS